MVALPRKEHRVSIARATTRVRRYPVPNLSVESDHDATDEWAIWDKHNPPLPTGWTGREGIPCSCCLLSVSRLRELDANLVAGGGLTAGFQGCDGEAGGLHGVDAARHEANLSGRDIRCRVLN